jgi:DNA-binding MarR family transcriptional regulator
MDRTTLTAALKSLERRGLITIAQDPADRRGRRLSMTSNGNALLALATPIWERAHRDVEGLLKDGDPDRLRSSLSAIT